MTAPESPPVRVAEAASGARLYQVDIAPEALPPVRPRDLHAAWDSARGAALAARWGRPLRLRFRRPGDEPLELTLADPDACCWADAVDATVGLATPYGLSVCLRLLALVDLVPRAGWARALVALKRDGAVIDAALVAAAARVPLGHDARYDPVQLRAAVAGRTALPAPPCPAPPCPVLCATGAPA